MVEADALLSGLSLPDYRPVRRIGQGGMASVYLAVQTSLGREIALKVLNPALSERPAFSERFLTEGRLLASLNHPNIVTIYDVGAQQGWLYIAMELLEGGSLRQRIRRGIDVAEALATTASVASALRNAHRKGIVHRDVKPSNILYRHNDSLVLTDFGIAKVLGEDSSLTRSGATVGSPYYLSPEQARGRPVDARTDIYSLGVILYEMLAGAKPFAGSSEIDTAMKHVSEPVPCLPPHLAHLQPLIDRTLAKEPDERFGEMGELIEALEAARDDCAQGSAGSAPARLPAVLAPAADGPRESHTRTIVLGPDDDDAAGLRLRSGRLPVSQRPRSASRWRRHRRAAAALAVLATAGLGWSVLTRDGGPSGASEPSTLVAGPVASTPEGVSPRDRHPSPGAAPTDHSQAPPRPTVEGHLAAADVGPADAVPSASPAPTAEVRSLVAEMEAALAEFRLTSPAGNNAAEIVERILTLDPGNHAAEAGRVRIGDRYALLAERRIEEGSRQRARVYVRRGLSVAPGHPSLLALQDDLASAPGAGRRASTEPGRPEGLLDRIKGLFTPTATVADTSDQWRDPADTSQGVRYSP